MVHFLAFHLRQKSFGTGPVKGKPTGQAVGPSEDKVHSERSASSECVCVCACMYLCVCVHVHLCVYICVYTCVYVCVVYIVVYALHVMVSVGVAKCARRYTCS